MEALSRRRGKGGRKSAEREAVGIAGMEKTKDDGEEEGK